MKKNDFRGSIKVIGITFVFMCGLNGIFSSDITRDWSSAIQRMNLKMAHRGPDADGVYNNGDITLGHRRLSIIDLDSRGTQPMHAVGGRFVIVFNGEIYNFEKLRKCVSTYPFQTGTDTEVILALYIEMGEKMLELLEGMFAFAIWDNEKGDLFVARDRFGKKPLYWWISEERDAFIFSSELRSIIASGWLKPRLNGRVLGQFLQYQTVFDPNTLVEGIFQLAGGHCARVQKDRDGKIAFEPWPYYERQQEIVKPNATNSYEDAVQKTRSLFESAVQKRLVSDVDFGAFLSGGVDSSAVVAMMAKHLSSPVKTFHVYFDESEFSERKYAELVAKKYNTDHQNILIKPLEFLNEVIPAVEAIDHPSADGVNTYVVSKYTRGAGIKMALSGLGGDEIFGGYGVFNRIQQVNRLRKAGVLQLWERIPRAIKKGLPAKGKLHELLNLAKIDESNVYELFRHFYSDAELTSLGIKSKTDFSWGIPIISGRLTTWVGNEEIEKYMKPVLLRDTDQMSMAHSLEVRVPFLDHKLTEFVMSLPDNLKPLKPGKKLLIDALGHDLPREVWDRKKMGFVFPWKQWVNNELKAIVDEGLDVVSNIPELGRAVEDLRVFQQSPINEKWHKAWLLSTLGHWIKNNQIEIKN